MNNRYNRERECLEEHDRLSKLFVEDRFSFERERKVLITRTINKSRNRKRLRALQNNWDRILKHAGSEHNRFVLIQMLFWNQVREGWCPALHNYEGVLRGSFSFS